MTTHEDLVIAAQLGLPVADWLEEKIEQEVRLKCAVKMRLHREDSRG